MTKILMLSDITGIGPEYHVGDEAMAEIAIQRLSKLAGAENLILGCTNPSGIPTTYGIESFCFYHTTNRFFYRMAIRKPLSFLKSFFINVYQVLLCDKIVICGGGNMTSVWPEILESRLRLLKIAIILKKDFYLVSQTLGPYNDIHRQAVNKILSRASFIGVRDIKYSKHQISYQTTPTLDDACFLTAKHNADTIKIRNSVGKNFAAISMRKFGKMTDETCNKVASAISKSTETLNIDSIFIPHHAPNGTEGDIRLANIVKHNWQSNIFHCVNPITIASALKALTSESKIVISMRYHQLIFGLSSGVPCVGIYVDEYTQAKLTGAFESFGITPLVVSIDSVEQKLDHLVKKALEMSEVFKSTAKNVLESEYDRSMEPYLAITESQKSNPKCEMVQ